MGRSGFFEGDGDDDGDDGHGQTMNVMQQRPCG
jgi:hypothetical protein